MNYFEKHQKFIVKLFNIDLVRSYLGIKETGVIVKVSPNSYHVWEGGNKFRAVFRGYPIYEKKLNDVFKIASLVTVGVSSKFTMLPFAIMLTSSNIYSGSGDGFIYHEGTGGESWSTVRDATDAAGGGSTTNYTSAGDTQTLQVWRTGTPIYAIRRAYFPFDTSSLGGGAEVSAATFSVYGQGSEINADVVWPVQTSQASNTALVSTDYDNVGSTKGSDSSITTASFNSGGYQDFTLNSTGIGWVDPSGYTKLGLRLGRDIDNNAPASATNYRAGCYFSEEAGTSKDPLLQVTYTLPAGASFLLNMV